MIKQLRSLREGELTRKNLELEQIQNLLIAYVFDSFEPFYRNVFRLF